MRVNKTKCPERVTLDWTRATHDKQGPQTEKNKSNLNWLRKLIRKKVGDKVLVNILAETTKLSRKLMSKKETKTCR